MEEMKGFVRSEAGDIPSDWAVSTVGSEFEIQLGKMLDSERNVGIKKPYLGNRAVQWGRIDASDLPSVPMTRADTEKYRLKKGDLLVCEGGEVGRAAIWNAPIDECYYQKALHRLRPRKDYDVRLMAEYFRRWSETGLLTNYVTQTSIAHLPRERIAEIPLPVPPPVEQRAIANALSDVDALIAGLEKLIAKKRDIKQAAMQQLLTGQTRLPGFIGEWESKKIGDLADVLKGLGLSKSLVQASGERPCILYGELFTTYGRAISTVYGRTNATEGVASKAGDVLLPGSTTTTGADLATASALLVDNVALGGDIIIVRRRGHGYDPVFLANLLTYTKRKEISELTQGITIHHLYGKDLATLPIELPPLAEQVAIGEILTEMEEEISGLTARRDKTLAIKQGMMQELLTGRTRLV